MRGGRRWDDEPLNNECRWDEPEDLSEDNPTPWFGIYPTPGPFLWRWLLGQLAIGGVVAAAWLLH